MIRRAGRMPYEDIDIQFTGLRPGEKLFEEINGYAQDIRRGYDEKVQIIREQPLSWALIQGWMEELEEMLRTQHEPDIIAHIRHLVPEYKPMAKWIGTQTDEYQAEEADVPRSVFWSREEATPGCPEKNGSCDKTVRRSDSGPPVFEH
jgi:hypothetical protein